MTIAHCRSHEIIPASCAGYSGRRSFSGDDSAAAPDQRSLRAQLDARVPAWLAEHAVTSVAIAHIQRSRRVLNVAYGAQSAGVPATADTLYNIASMAKPIGRSGAAGTRSDQQGPGIRAVPASAGGGIIPLPLAGEG
jgi:CubicO group peptidase (beta-lactamase class C family)